MHLGLHSDVPTWGRVRQRLKPEVHPTSGRLRSSEARGAAPGAAPAGAPARPLCRKHSIGRTHSYALSDALSRHSLGRTRSDTLARTCLVGRLISCTQSLGRVWLVG